MAWYETKDNSRVDLISKIAPTGALGAKAIGDSFLDIAKTIDDREKFDIAKQEAEVKKKKLDFDLSKAYEDDNQNKANKTYQKYVDPKTGTFNEEQFKNENPNMSLGDVSIDVRKNTVDLANAYKLNQEQDIKNTVSKGIGKALVGSKTKEEFYSKLTPDIIENISGDAAIKIEDHFNKLDKQEQDIKFQKQDLANSMKLYKLEQELVEEKKKGLGTKDVKAADDSLIGKNISAYFGGTYDPATESFIVTDPKVRQKVNELSSLASSIYKSTKGITHNEAASMAIKTYEKSIKEKDAKDEADAKIKEDPLGAFFNR